MVVFEKIDIINYLKEKGFKNVNSYVLINNEGCTFECGSVKYDLRHWLNCYGCDVDYYTLDGKDIENEKYISCGSFNKLKDVIEYIERGNIK